MAVDQLGLWLKELSQKFRENSEYRPSQVIHDYFGTHTIYFTEDEDGLPYAYLQWLTIPYEVNAEIDGSIHGDLCAFRIYYTEG